MAQVVYGGSLTVINAYSQRLFETIGGAVASWSVRSSPDQGVQVQGLVEDIVFY